MSTIDLSPEFTHALALMEEGSDSLFITGRAGTGKSTLLTYFQKHTQLKVVVLAPTGVAALNVKGATIHSFFGFRPDITMEKAWKLGGKTKKPDLYKNLDAIVIDEISMVRADLLDCVDAFMRRVCLSSRPFGGKRLILFGDLYQLPPVVTGDELEIFTSRYPTPYFFSADVMSRLSLTYVELTHIYRQSDAEFIAALNAIRDAAATSAHLALLNTRLAPDYAPPPEEYVVTLAGTNREADAYNAYQLSSLPGRVHDFSASSTGSFGARTQPAPDLLRLKLGAQVMFTANDHESHHYVNGTIGRVEEIGEVDGVPVVSVRTRAGRLIDVGPHTWEMFAYTYSPRARRLETEVSGTYTQVPLTLAWGVTVHKAQGKTFERVVVDLPRSFAHGQTYVALSRATSLDGLILRRPLTPAHIIMDPTVSAWLAMLKETQSL